MRLLASFLFSALVCSASTAAHADTVANFTLTGGDGTFTFSLPGTATPAASNVSYALFNLASATGNGQTAADSTVYFYTQSDLGGLALESSDGTLFLEEYGPTIFSGTTANPVFSNGSFTLSNGFSTINGVSSNASGDLLTVSVLPAASVVPEPSTIALLGTGAVSLAAFARRFWPA